MYVGVVLINMLELQLTPPKQKFLTPPLQKPHHLALFCPIAIPTLNGTI